MKKKASVTTNNQVASVATPTNVTKNQAKGGKCFKSKIKGSALNIIANEISNVEITKLGELPDDGEIIHIKFKNNTEKFINTETNVISTTLKAAITKKETNCILQNNRLTTVISVGKYINGTRLHLGTLIGLAMEFYNGISRPSYIGYEVNHKDRTGSKSIYGYLNNKIYNMEVCRKDDNERHWRCVERIQDELDIHVSFSANNPYYLFAFEFYEIDTIKRIIECNTKFVDRYGTVVLN